MREAKHTCLGFGGELYNVKTCLKGLREEANSIEWVAVNCFWESKE